MGHLINPITFRLGYAKNWGFSGALMESKSQYTYLNLKFQNLFKFFERFFRKKVFIRKLGIIFSHLKLISGNKKNIIMLYFYDGPYPLKMSMYFKALKKRKILWRIILKLSKFFSKFYFKNIIKKQRFFLVKHLKFRKKIFSFLYNILIKKIFFLLNKNFFFCLKKIQSLKNGLSFYLILCNLIKLFYDLIFNITQINILNYANFLYSFFKILLTFFFNLNYLNFNNKLFFIKKKFNFFFFNKNYLFFYNLFFNALFIKFYRLQFFSFFFLSIRGLVFSLCLISKFLDSSSFVKQLVLKLKNFFFKSKKRRFLLLDSFLKFNFFSNYYFFNFVKLLLENLKINKILNLNKLNKNLVYLKRIRKIDINSNIIAKYICIRLKQRFRLQSILNPIIKDLLKNKFINGFRISCRGRFSKKEIAAYKWEKRGKLSLNTVKQFIDYSYQTVILKYSICGIKVWLQRKFKFFNKKNFLFFRRYRNLKKITGIQITKTKKKSKNIVKRFKKEKKDLFGLTSKHLKDKLNFKNYEILNKKIKNFKLILNKNRKINNKFYKFVALYTFDLRNSYNFLTLKKNIYFINNDYKFFRKKRLEKKLNSVFLKLKKKLFYINLLKIGKLFKKNIVFYKKNFKSNNNNNVKNILFKFHKKYYCKNLKKLELNFFIYKRKIRFFYKIFLFRFLKKLKSKLKLKNFKIFRVDSFREIVLQLKNYKFFFIKVFTKFNHIRNVRYLYVSSNKKVNIYINNLKKKFFFFKLKVWKKISLLNFFDDSAKLTFYDILRNKMKMLFLIKIKCIKLRSVLKNLVNFYVTFNFIFKQKLLCLNFRNMRYNQISRYRIFNFKNFLISNNSLENLKFVLNYFLNFFKLKVKNKNFIFIKNISFNKFRVKKIKKKLILFCFQNFLFIYFKFLNEKIFFNLKLKKKLKVKNKKYKINFLKTKFKKNKSNKFFLVEKKYFKSKNKINNNFLLFKLKKFKNVKIAMKNLIFKSFKIKLKYRFKIIFNLLLKKKKNNLLKFYFYHNLKKKILLKNKKKFFLLKFNFFFKLFDQFSILLFQYNQQLLNKKKLDLLFVSYNKLFKFLNDNNKFLVKNKFFYYKNYNKKSL